MKAKGYYEVKKAEPSFAMVKKLRCDRTEKREGLSDFESDSILASVACSLLVGKMFAVR